MNNITKNTLIIVGSVLSVIAVFCVAVCIACSVTGLTFSDQIVDWFTKVPELVDDLNEETLSAMIK